MLHALILGHVCCRHLLGWKMFQSMRLGSSNVQLDETHDNPRDGDPSYGPAYFAVHIVLIKIWGPIVVNHAKKERKGIDKKKKELDGKHQARLGNAQHHTWWWSANSKKAQFQLPWPTKWQHDKPRQDLESNVPVHQSCVLEEAPVTLRWRTLLHFHGATAVLIAMFTMSAVGNCQRKGP